MSSSPLWFQNISLDVIFILADWLDPMSILQLNRTCKAFHAVIGDDNPTWRRALQRVAAEYCISPHSFDNLSNNDLKVFATRPARLIETLQDSTQSVYAGMRKYILDYGAILSPPASQNEWGELDLEHMPATLLPGGRWIISGVLNHATDSTYICCWDLSEPSESERLLQPAATFIWEGLRPPSPYGWMQAQSYDSDCVILACRLCGWENTFPSSYSILRLSWAAESTLPIFENIARLNMADYPTIIEQYPEYHLEGDYLLLDTLSSITVWDWKQDQIGLVDSEQHEWVSGAGFLIITKPPYIFIFPDQMKEVIVLEFPKLHPVGSPKSLELACPTSKISYPFLEDNYHLQTSEIYLLDKWKPPSLRSGLAILHLYPQRWEEEKPRFYAISLQPSNATPPRPSHVEQLAGSLPTRELENMVVVDGVGVALVKYPQLSDPRQRLDTLFYSFSEDDGLRTPDGKGYEDLFPDGGPPMPFDFVSGTALLNRGNEPSNPEKLIFDIVSFDFRNQSVNLQTAIE
ncbi:hypothetical protein DL93DRAFT_2233235 [Clavulina sp. PMI_390]|nr:hypothetical protein DL93DRAFT_2233235 [Clavulina sp. PMI_390]